VLILTCGSDCLSSSCQAYSNEPNTKQSKGRRFWNGNSAEMQIVYKDKIIHPVSDDDSIKR
jgi:hypothetical protein